MTEYTGAGTVTIDGTPHQVTFDLTAAPVAPAGGSGGGGGTTGGGGGQAPAGCYFGIWDPATVDWSSGNPVGTWAGAQKFAAAPVKSVTYFAAWRSPQPTMLYALAKQHGATVYLNLEAQNTWGGLPNPKISDIAAGKEDSYLIAVGQAIKASGATQWVTWCHEMNGDWYPWGRNNISPATWVSGWKHVCDVIRANAGGNAKMVWCPNNIDVAPLDPYWPGNDYVDIAAFDGYLNENSPTLTYENFVKQTPDAIRALGWTQPIWNAETGVYSFPNRAARYTQFINDMKADGLLGFTQWNEQSYALNSTEIAAVTAAVNAWNNG